jgi:hypothetical protein
MLDIHCVKGTPGATTVLADLTGIPVGDLAVVAGVPLRPDARLILWGSESLVANTIYLTKLQSQDQVDPLNGELMNLGTASLQNEAHKFTNILYKTGARVISQTTNTAQTATSLGITLDHYEGGPVISADGVRFKENQVTLTQTLGQNVAVAWRTTGFAPAVAMPNGKYALLGCQAALLTDPACIRFNHADFGSFQPGFPIIELGASDILGHQKGMKDLLMASPGYQFVQLSEMTKKPLIPVFTVSNAGTGLNIQMIAPTNTDTPVITLNLAKIA